MAISPLKPAVFFDRDGVLNEIRFDAGIPKPPAQLADFRVSRGAPEACRELAALGFALVVVTNQPDVARGDQDRLVVEAMNELLCRELPILGVFVCYHDDRDDCACRKPKPGLLFQAAREFELDLSRAFLVGDRWRDVEAGRGAGCRTILLEREYSERWRCQPDWIVSDISSVPSVIIDGSCP